MTLRSPKLDDPAFIERISVPALPTMKVSARDILGGDYPNYFFAILASLLQMAEDDSCEVADLLTQFAVRREPYRKFNDVYTQDEYLDLAARQDPGDIAELDAVVVGLNELFAERRVTNAAVKELLSRAGAVFDKYRD